MHDTQLLQRVREAARDQQFYLFPLGPPNWELEPFEPDYRRYKFGTLEFLAGCLGVNCE